MSQTNQVNPEHLKQAAFEVLSSKVSSAVFFEKLASHGIVPTTEEEAYQLLQAGDFLYGAQSQKTASDLNEPLRALGQIAGDPDQPYKQAAAVLAQDPEIFESVLVLAAMGDK